MQTSHETIAVCGVGEYTQHALRLPRKPMHESLRCVCNKLNKTNAPCSRRHFNHFPTHPSIGGQCTKYRDSATRKKKGHVFIWSGTNACRQHRDNTIMTMTKMNKPSPQFPANARLRTSLEPKPCAPLWHARPPNWNSLLGCLLISSFLFFSFLDVHVLRIKNRTEWLMKTVIKNNSAPPAVLRWACHDPTRAVKDDALRRVAARKGTIMHFGIHNSPLWTRSCLAPCWPNKKKSAASVDTQSRTSLWITHFDYMANNNTQCSAPLKSVWTVN